MRGGPCEFCHLKPQCLPDHVLGAAGVRTLQSLVASGPPRARGSYLFREGDERRAYYFIRAGSAKSFVTDENGSESVTGFYFPTDMVGAAAIEHQRYPESVILLERASVCEISANALEDLCRGEPALYHSFFEKIGQSFDLERRARLRLNRASADERVCDFLGEISQRMRELGRPDDRFTLSMSRYDIANYLGLAAETVSRSLRRLQDEGVIEVKGKQLTLAKPKAQTRAGIHGSRN